MNTLSRYFANLSRRERLMLMATLVFIVLIALWTQFLQPRYQALVSLRQQVHTQLQVNGDLRNAISIAAPLLAAKRKNRDKNQPAVLQLVEQTADKEQIRSFITQMKPGEEQTVKVRLENAGFDAWLGWLDVLQKKGINIIAAKVSHSLTQGVNIQMTLTRN